MGGGLSNTNPNKNGVIVDEPKSCKNIISLSEILSAINKQTKDPIKLLVINELKNEIPIALNFIMSVNHLDDLYNTFTQIEYNIVNISAWHKHNCSFSVYLNLLKNSKNNSIINQCMCLLTENQLKYYNFLTSNNN